VAHGTQKLFGWFGGPGPDGFARMMEGADMRQAAAAVLAIEAGKRGGQA